MSKPQLIKRAVQGGYIKADTTGAGNWEIGKITFVEPNHISFTSAVDGETVRIGRADAFKATKAEYDQALKDAGGEVSNDSQAPEAEEDEAPAPVGLTDMEDESGDLDLGEGDEDAERNASMIDPKYKQMYGTIVVEGRRTQICGDATSQELVAMDLVDVYRLVSRECNLDFNVLVQKYAHLNRGQQKMCLSNRLRAYRRKQAKQAEEALHETGDFLAEESE